MPNLRIGSRELWDTPLMNVLTEEIISRLDENPMSAKARSKVAYRIINETNYRDELVDKILDEFRCDFKDRRLLEQLTDSLWNERVASNRGKDDNLLHLAWGVLPEEGVLDGYLAEHYYHWAAKLGIPEEKISSILLETQSELHDI